MLPGELERLSVARSTDPALRWLRHQMLEICSEGATNLLTINRMTKPAWGHEREWEERAARVRSTPES